MKRSDLQARFEVGMTRFANLPRRPKLLGATCGVVSGVALGIFSGPVGVCLGSLLGFGVGFMAGMIVAEEDDSRSRRTRELDAIIGITSGSMGGAKVAPRPSEEDDGDEGEKLSSREAWMAEWLTPPPPNVMG